jgi:hypothetical protein
MVEMEAKQETSFARYLLHAGFMLNLLYDYGYVGDTFFRNVE